MSFILCFFKIQQERERRERETEGAYCNCNCECVQRTQAKWLSGGRRRSVYLRVNV